MGGCRVTDFIDTFHDRIQSRVVADRDIRAIQVIINRTRQADNRIIELLCKDASPRQRSVTTDGDQSIDTMLHQFVVSLLTAFRRLEFCTTGRLQDSTATLNNITYILSLEIFNFVGYQTLVSTIDTLNGHSVINSGTCHCANGSVHSGSITSGR